MLGQLISEFMASPEYSTLNHNFKDDKDIRGGALLVYKLDNETLCRHLDLSMDSLHTYLLKYQEYRVLRDKLTELSAKKSHLEKELASSNTVVKNTESLDKAKRNNERSNKEAFEGEISELTQKIFELEEIKKSRIEIINTMLFKFNKVYKKGFGEVLEKMVASLQEKLNQMKQEYSDLSKQVDLTHLKELKSQIARKESDIDYFMTESKKDPNPEIKIALQQTYSELRVLINEKVKLESIINKYDFELSVLKDQIAYERAQYTSWISMKAAIETPLKEVTEIEITVDKSRERIAELKQQMKITLNPLKETFKNTTVLGEAITQKETEFEEVSKQVDDLEMEISKLTNVKTLLEEVMNIRETFFLKFEKYFLELAKVVPQFKLLNLKEVESSILSSSNPEIANLIMNLAFRLAYYSVANIDQPELTIYSRYKDDVVIPSLINYFKGKTDISKIYVM